MTPDQKIQALKDEIAASDKEFELAAATQARQDSPIERWGRREEALRDIAILEKFQNKSPDLLPEMEANLRANIQIWQTDFNKAQRKLADFSGELAELERFKQLLNS